MKEKKITFEKARKISIIDSLKKSGHAPKKQSEKEVWFLSPFRPESEPSFKVSLEKNCWYDFGIGQGGNVIDLMMKLNSLTAYEAIEKLENGSFSFHSPPQLIENENNTKITKVIEIQHCALLQYLKARNIYSFAGEPHLKEIQYELKGKNYFAIGFQNRSLGYELRSKYTKICIGKKDITLIENNSNTICVFEGFIDYLSYKNLNCAFYNQNCDFLILNSIALINKCDPILDKYSLIELYLDNDAAGKNCTNQILSKHQNAIDKSSLYSEHKDLNDWLLKRK